MQLPADLRTVNLGGLAGAANAFTALTAIAAPGVALRLRIWGVMGAFDDSSQAPTHTYAGTYDAVTGVAIVSWSTQDFDSQGRWIPGGYLMVANRALTAFIKSSVAGVSISIVVYYTIEAV